jgi:hypothetical protein
MAFEYDLKKSNENLTKHGINFEDAQELWNDPNCIVIPAKTLDEKRYLLIGNLDGKIWSAIFTIRRKKIRIISVRRARQNEKEIYKS